ncbi:helix-turn-helix transcriptional regulator [Bacillaceae bacterium SIJ1]|uniref:helix-turn-helix domain-containing protein n=1 Tax=Litoribacterium kuwaitense TaxID=1398745 RepID=UPI0013EB680F|nr:helix-turn-helix transcriptional regulator [Litoribacterium kuwaitense]NGP46806.1 helix-turn-helix transcriptional regulator [Litoribacterium kuwaitense]
MELGERIKQLRKAKQWTQEELGEKVYVSHMSIWGYEKGNRLPILPTLIAMADVFNVSLDELLQTEQTTTEEVLWNRLEKQLFAGDDDTSFLDVDTWASLPQEELGQMRDYLVWLAAEKQQSK